MFGILAAAGGMVAGLVLLGTVLPSLLKAWTTGVIVSKAYGAPRIERAVDPERFRRLLATRVGAFWSAIGILSFSTGLLAWQLFNIWLINRQTPL